MATAPYLTRATGIAPGEMADLEADDTDDPLASPTQIAEDSADYLGYDNDELGLRVSEEEVEVFVDGPVLGAFDALLQKHEHEFVALQDVGATVGNLLMTALSRSLSQPLQRLTVRRQGYGVPLATLQFMDVPQADNRWLRIYLAACDGDRATREGMSHLLMGRAQLAVLLVSDIPGHVLDTALQPLRTALAERRYPPNEMLVVPLAQVSLLAAQAQELARLRGAPVRVTPMVLRPAEAWAYISGTYGRLRRPVAAEAEGAAAATPDAAASGADDSTPDAATPDFQETQALALAPMPGEPDYVESEDLAAQEPQAEDSPDLLAHYVHDVMRNNGVAACCAFDYATQQSLVHVGLRPGALALAAQGALMMRSMAQSSLVLGLGTTLPGAVIAMADKNLVLHPMPAFPGVVLNVVVDRGKGYLENLRAELWRLDQAAVNAQRRRPG